METVEQEQVGSASLGLPANVQDALGELAGAAKEGLLVLSVGVGLGVLGEMTEAELDEVVGPKHARISGRGSPMVVEVSAIGSDHDRTEEEV